jgi:uncharacterized protein YcfJ
MRELRRPVSGHHRIVHMVIWALVGVLLGTFLLPGILGVMLVIVGAAD